MNRRDFIKLSGRLAAIWGVNPKGLVKMPEKNEAVEPEGESNLAEPDPTWETERKPWGPYFCDAATWQERFGIE
jgi:hypothetical protein